MTNQLNERQLELLKDVFFLEQDELHNYAKSFLLSFYEEENFFEAKGEGIYVKGEIPVLLVAHMDTVHLVKPTEDTLFFDQEKNVMWCPDGLGADCRAGVYNIFEIIGKGYRPHVMLTWDEEIGGVGASKLMDRWADGVSAESLLVQDAMLDVNFAVQFDRKGYSEAVYYDLDNEEFEKYISSFGYRTDIGSFTDICEICPAFGFAGVNVSAGYINEHYTNEMLLIDEMLETQRKAIQILEDQIKNPVFYEYKAIEYGGGFGFYDPTKYPSYAYGYEDYWDVGRKKNPLEDISKEEEAYEPECFFCGVVLEEGVNWQKAFDEYQNAVCYDCRVSNWQESAEVPFEKLREIL